MDASVLDASALLALIKGEEGQDEVVDALAGGCAISAVNLAEVASKLVEAGADPDLAYGHIQELGEDALIVEPLQQADIVEIARLRPATKDLGLSLAGRACLALAHRLQVPALTTDRAWAELQARNLAVRLIR